MYHKGLIATCIVAPRIILLHFMSPVCAADQLVPHLGQRRRRYCGSSYAAGVTGLAALALASPPKTRRLTTIRATLEPHGIDKPWQAQRAAVLAIGTANPAHSMPQDEYADWYFRVTNSDHLHQLKDKMKRICEHQPFSCHSFCFICLLECMKSKSRSPTRPNELKNIPLHLVGTAPFFLRTTA